MKKFVAVLLMFLLLYSFAAFALEATYTRPEINTIPKDDSIMKGEFLLGGSTDVVTVEGNVMTIVTEDGLVFKYRESENVYAISQSIIASAKYLERFYDDANARAAQYVSNNTHLELIGFTSGSGYVHAFFHDAGSDSLAALIGNAASLSVQDADAITNMLKGEFGCEFIYGTLGGNVWFVGDAVDTEEECVFFITWVGGHQIYGYAYLGSDATVEDAYDVMENLIISAK